jgi:hypothetical protein
VGTRLVAVAGLTGLMFSVGVGSANAVRPLEREHYADEDSTDLVLCGLDVHREQTISGNLSLRLAPGSEQAFLSLDNYKYTNVFTLNDDDATTNEFVRVEANGVFREQNARLVDPDEPDVYTFRAVEAAQFRVYGSDGELLYRNSGVVKYTAVIDTLGDGEPGGEFLDEVIVEHGYKDVEFCGVLVAELT